MSIGVDQGARVGQCPYPTEVCAPTLGDSFFFCLFLLLIDHSFVIYLVSSFLNVLWTFYYSVSRLSLSPKPFPPFESVIFEGHSGYPKFDPSV